MSLSSYRVETCREAIAAKNHELRAVLHVVEKPTKRRTLEGPGPLDGVPFVLKDSWDTAGVPTTGGAYRNKGRVPEVSSHAAAALFESGALLLGKSNVGDMCLSAESDNHLFGAAKNPIDMRRTAGGSTGGGAAAVASGMAAFDWGTDFGGSVRIPAAFCGLVGLRLSASVWPVEKNHFPRIGEHFWPMVAMGPVTRRVAEARELVDVLAPALRVAHAPTLDVDAFSSEVALLEPDRAHLGSWPGFADEMRDYLVKQGLVARVERDLLAPSQGQLAFDAWLSLHLAKLPGPGEPSIAQGLLPTLLGLFTWGKLDKRIHPNTGANLLLCGIGALAFRPFRARLEGLVRDVRCEVERVWKSGRLVIAPTTTQPAPRHGRALFSPSLLTFGKYGNLVDATSIAVPFGRFPDGLPRSFQIMGPPGSERAVLAMAERLEQAAD